MILARVVASEKIKITYNNFKIDPLNRYFLAKNGTENVLIIHPPVWECPPRGSAMSKALDGKNRSTEFNSVDV